MTHRQQSWLAVATTAAVLLLNSGCGSSSPSTRDVKGIAVKGRLLMNGKPIKLKPDETIIVTFFDTKDDPEGKISSAGPIDGTDGTFEIKGPSGNGIPSGKYIVTLTSEVYGGGDNRFDEDFNSETSLLRADVGTDEGQFFDIDLATKRVTKKK
jgi:hypothetical protein